VWRVGSSDETAIEPGFQAHFVRAMGFPDSTERRPSKWESSPTPTGRVMSDDETTVTAPRPGGAAPAAAAAGRRRASPRHVEASPFLTRTLAPFEVLSDEGLGLIEQQTPTVFSRRSAYRP